MKISSQLSAVIRHHFEGPDFRSGQESNKTAAIKSAVLDYCKKHPRIKAMLRKAAELRKKLDPIESELSAIGITESGWIFNERKFREAGGNVDHIPYISHRMVIGQIASMEPEAALAQLKEYGIDWTPAHCPAKKGGQS